MYRGPAEQIAAAIISANKRTFFIEFIDGIKFYRLYKCEILLFEAYFDLRIKGYFQFINLIYAIANLKTRFYNDCLGIEIFIKDLYYLYFVFTFIKIVNSWAILSLLRSYSTKIKHYFESFIA